MGRGKMVLSLTITMAIMLSGMTIFELVKQRLHPAVTVWQSHFITIVFSSILATVGAYFLARRRRESLGQLSEEIAESERTNQELVNWSRKLEGLNREIHLLNQMSNFMQSCQTVNEVSGIIAQTVKELFPHDSGGLYMFRNSRNLLEVAAVWGESPPGETAFSPEDCWAIRLGRDHRFPDVASPIGLRCNHVDAEVGTYVCMLMTVQGEVLGSLYLTRGCEDDGEKWLYDKQLILTRLTEQIGLVLWNMKLRDDLRNLSIRDPLTGLFNRRFMEEFMDRELVYAARKGTTVGVIMFDIDQFKRLNDTFGHDAGDAVLREVGALLLSNVRGSDIVCRYGGEEFVAILPEVSQEAALARAESIRDKVTHMSVVHANQILGPIRVSAGVAVAPDQGATRETVVCAADAALYQAKRDGRNRVCAANPNEHGAIALP
jgi:diguanylate cyclase (GGDEF)-like protein